jgi:hypothetical protein
MPDRLREAVTRGWRVLLTAAVCVLGVTALATALGLDALAHLAGTGAWLLAVVGAIAGLLATRRSEEARS